MARGGLILGSTAAAKFADRQGSRGYMRLSIGIEDIDGILADLGQALTRAFDHESSFIALANSA